MAVRFIIGRAGTGKTKHCFDRVVSLLKQEPLGAPIYWIVPKQATFQTERELTTLSGLPGFCRVRIISFEWLGQEILESTSGAAIPLISGAGRQMLIGHLLRKHANELKFYRSSARQVGLASQLDLTFGELEREGHLPEDILKNAAGDEGMNDKLADLALLYRLQHDFLGQDRLDPHRRMQMIVDHLPECPHFDQVDVFIDNFYEFSSHERKLIAGLSQVCRQIDITLTMDPEAKILRNPHQLPDEMGLFRRTEETYRKLYFELDQAHVQIDPVMKLYSSLRFSRSKTLSHIEDQAMQRHPKTFSDPKGVEFIEAFDRRGEVNAAARQIRQWMSEGFRYRDIAVLVRSIDDYQDWIAAAFNEHEIPYFVDRRRPASYHPLTQLARAMVSAVVKRFGHDDMMAMLKSGLSGLDRDQSDAVENYVIEHQVRNDVWTAEAAWKDALGLRDEDDDLAPAAVQFDIDSLRRQIIAPLLPLRKLLANPEPQPLRQYAAGLYQALDAMQVRSQLETWIADANANQDLEQAAEHQQVWSSLIELLDQMVDLLGDEPILAEDFLTILEAGLEQFDLALTPPTLDQVLVGDVDRTRTTDLRCVIVLGLNDGDFPRRPGESNIFSDRERAALEQRGISLGVASDKYLLDERFLAYIAFTRASERMTLMRFDCNGAGCETQASIFWQKLRLALPDAPLHRVRPEHQESASQIGTKKQLTRYLLAQIRAKTTVEAMSPDEASLYHWLATEGRDEVIESSWKSLCYNNSAILSKDVAGQVFPSPLAASVSRIETFATCRFKHFVRYGLGLRPRDDNAITPLRLGTIYHGVLERFVRKLLKDHADWGEILSPESPELLKRITEDVARRVVDAILYGHPRSKYLLRFVRDTVHRVLLAQVEASKLGNTAPLGAEVSFGPEARLSALRLRTRKRRQIELAGKIDRVDLIGEDGFAVFDYKTHQNRLRLDRVLHGLSLQLLTYLIVAHAHSRKINAEGKRLSPAGALYLTLVRGFYRTPDPSAELSPDDPDFHLQVQPRGLVHADYIGEFDETGTQGSAKVISSFISKAGELGRRRTTDTIAPAEFRALMRQVRKNIKELSDEIMDGAIDISPYRIGIETPCPRCEYRTVCRFDLSTGDGYRILPAMNRASVLNLLAGRPAEGEGGDE